MYTKNELLFLVSLILTSCVTPDSYANLQGGLSEDEFIKCIKSEQSTAVDEFRCSGRVCAIEDSNDDFHQIVALARNSAVKVFDEVGTSYQSLEAGFSVNQQNYMILYETNGSQCSVRAGRVVD